MTKEIDVYDPDALTNATDTQSLEIIHHCQRKGLELFYVVAKMLYYRKLDYDIGRNTEYDTWRDYCVAAGYLPDRANAIVKEFPLMDEAIRYGLGEKLFQVKQQDMIKHSRLYLEAKCDGPPDKKQVEKILDVAISMPDREAFRKWYQDEIKGHTKLNPTRELSATQKKAIAWDKLYEYSSDEQRLTMQEILEGVK